MALVEKLFILSATVFVLCSLSRSAFATIGVATYYNPHRTTGYTPSACHGSKYEGVMVAAASKELYENRGVCGKKLKVTCQSAAYQSSHNPCKANNVVYVNVVDLCPGCHGKHFDLSRHAFQSIASLSAGKIKIDFQFVA